MESVPFSPLTVALTDRPSRMTGNPTLGPSSDTSDTPSTAESLLVDLQLHPQVVLRFFLQKRRQRWIHPENLHHFLGEAMRTGIQLSTSSGNCCTHTLPAALPLGYLCFHLQLAFNQ